MTYRGPATVGHVQHNVGRLVEGRPLGLRTPEEARAYCDAFRTAVVGVGRRVVVCADYRHVGVFPPFAADALQALMRDMNDLVERSAIAVAPEHATASLQVGRVVARAGHPSRRRFEDVAELQVWLGEVLDPAEQARAAAFLAAT